MTARFIETTFDRIWPGAGEGFQSDDLIWEMLKIGTAKPCWQCQQPTAWVEVNFEAHLCSPHCVDKAWTEFFEALERTPGGVRIPGEPNDATATPESQTP